MVLTKDIELQPITNAVLSHLAVPSGILQKLCSFRIFLTDFTNGLIKVNSVTIILPEASHLRMPLICFLYMRIVLFFSSLAILKIWGF